MKVEWTEEATDQLIAVRDFLARTFPAYAQAFAERVIRRTEFLESQPRFGAEVPEYADETIREVYEHPYRIIYRVDEERVQVVAVIHSSRRMPRTLPG